MSRTGRPQAVLVLTSEQRAQLVSPGAGALTAAGVDTLHGHAQFTGPTHLEVDGAGYPTRVP